MSSNFCAKMALVSPINENKNAVRMTKATVVSGWKIVRGSKISDVVVTSSAMINPRNIPPQQ